MSGMYRLPYITGTTQQEQLGQIKSFLYQLVQQLNAAPDTAAPAALPENTPRAETTQTPEAAFQKIKGLIIKSADIVQAFTTQTEKLLEGKYVAQSVFGDYQQETRRIITENDRYTRETFTNLQAITAKIPGLAEAVSKTQGAIRTGELFLVGDGEETVLGSGLQEGTPVYGIEIGQKSGAEGEEKTFSKFARFTAYGIAFYDENDNEAAYITDRTLHIREAQIKLSLRLGNFVETADADGGTVTRWVGV